MLRIKFKGFGNSFTDLNQPFYRCILDPNVEYQVLESTETDFIFTSGGNSRHRVAKNDDTIIVLEDLTPRLVYVLFEFGEETDQYFLTLSEIPYLNPNIFQHEYKLMWKLI